MKHMPINWLSQAEFSDGDLLKKPIEYSQEYTTMDIKKPQQNALVL